MAVRLRHGAADLPAFLSSHAAKQYVAWHRVQRDEATKVQRSIHLQAQALRLTAALMALLAVALLWQALLRGAAVEALAHPTLRALGMTRRQLLALDLLRALAIGALAAVLAVAVAAALSPLAPIGLARELEPRPGFAVDALVLALGGGAVLVAVLAGGALAGWRSARVQEMRPAPTGSVPAADTMARLGLPSTAVMGVRLALARGRGATAVPVGATLLGAVLAVAVAVSALTFSASLDHLFSTPRLYGENWDYRSELAVIGRVDPLVSALRANPAIADATLGTDGEAADVNGRQVGFRAMDDVKGHLPPVVLEGRAPRTDDEILLGDAHAAGARGADRRHRHGRLQGPHARRRPGRPAARAEQRSRRGRRGDVQRLGRAGSSGVTPPQSCRCGSRMVRTGPGHCAGSSGSSIRRLVCRGTSPTSAASGSCRWCSRHWWWPCPPARWRTRSSRRSAAAGASSRS